MTMQRFETTFGNGRSLQFQAPSDRITLDGTRNEESTVAAEERVRTAIAEPLEYPSLHDSLAPGDRVAISLDPDLPAASEVAAAFVQALCEAGVSPPDVCVVVTRRFSQASVETLRSALPKTIAQETAITVHEPENPRSLAYLAADRDALPMYVNRALCDADVMIPLGAIRLDDALGYHGVHSSWYPAFSNLDTQLRFFQSDEKERRGRHDRRRELAEEVAWQLGALCTLQIVPGTNNAVGATFFGEIAAVARVARDACERRWRFTLNDEPDLIVSAIDAADGWNGFARAVAAAGRITADDGAIVLWTDLSETPGPALRHLNKHKFSEESQRQAILHDHAFDALAADALRETLQSRHIYLHSRLSDSVVEQIGLTAIHDVAELEHLAAASKRCVVVGSGQNVGFKLA